MSWRDDPDPEPPEPFDRVQYEVDVITAERVTSGYDPHGEDAWVEDLVDEDAERLSAEHLDGKDRTYWLLGGWRR